MKNSIPLLILGVLALIAGVTMYTIDWHRTIGLGGSALGVLLLLAGGYMFTKEKKPAAPMQPQ